ncbi:MAG: T9SS type A sorting domain-containing protein [Edaphocola sp.]
MVRLFGVLFLGGDGDELYGNIAPVSDSIFYLVGSTFSLQNISTQGSYQENLSFHPSYPSSNYGNGFIAKFAPAPQTELSVPVFGQNNFLIYPNPTNGTVYFSDYLKTRVYNTSGQAIITNDFSKQLNIAARPNGVYFVTLTDKKGHTKQVKIIKK